MCPRRFMFRYVLGLEPEFRSVALVLGSTVGSAIGWWFEEKLARKTPTIDDALLVFEADFEAETLGMPVRWKNAPREALIEQGRGLVGLYLREQGGLSVARVEEAFRFDLEDPETGEVLPRALKGYFDLVLEDGTIVELKTSSRRWSDLELTRHLQIGAYVAADHVRSGGDPSRLHVHVLVKTKSPRLEVLTVERTEGQNRWWLMAAMELERAILAGHYPPSPGPLCIECEHGRACSGWAHEAPRHQAPKSLPVLHRDESPVALTI
jgi:hypothetical protein